MNIADAGRAPFRADRPRHGEAEKSANSPARAAHGMASRSPKIEHRKAVLDQARIYTYSPKWRLEEARSETAPNENSPLFSDVFSV